MSRLTAEDYTYISFAEGEKPTKGAYFELKLNHWWIVHPERGLLMYNPKNNRGVRRRLFGAPQCNPDRRITDGLREKEHSLVIEGLETRFFERIFVPVDMSEWAE